MSELNTNRFATIDREKPMSAILKVVGVGGGGCNAVESMINKGLRGVEYVAINTDVQVLAKNSAHQKIQIGCKLTGGLGAGANPDIGKKAAEEDRDKIMEALNGANMVFITCGMGGGTGTGAAPIVASIAKSVNALVVGICTKPFPWEGKLRNENAEKGINELRHSVDSLIVIPNSRLNSTIDQNVSAFKSFDIPNEILYEATKGIADIITVEGLINVDFADVKTVMSQSGVAVMGCGIASGENRAIEAAQRAISSPLLDGVNIKGAKHVLINVTGSNSLTMGELYSGNEVIYKAAGEEANIIFGAVCKEEMNDFVSYTVIATGFDSIDKRKLKNDNSSKNFGTTRSGFPKKPLNETFSFMNSSDDIDPNDLDTPTIIRNQSQKNQIPTRRDIEERNRRLDSEKFSNYQHDLSNREDLIPHKYSNDDDETTSFLNMIID